LSFCGHQKFRLHKTAKPEQATLFFVEWEKYLQHIERTGREKQSIELGLVDPPSKQRGDHQRSQQQLGMATGWISSASSSSSSPLSPSTIMTQHHGRSTTTTTDNDDGGGGGGGTVVYFGKDISNDIVFSEEQVSKLEQLRDEATKAASASVNTSGDTGKK